MDGCACVDAGGLSVVKGELQRFEPDKRPNVWALSPPFCEHLKPAQLSWTLAMRGFLGRRRIIIIDLYDHSASEAQAWPSTPLC